MVIQRIQTVWLLIAAILMVCVNFLVPIAQYSVSGQVISAYMSAWPELLVVNLITAALLLVAIFLYKTLPLQMKLTRISIVLIIVSLLFDIYVLYTLGEIAVWVGSLCIIAAASIAAVLALSGMKKDYKLLCSYDRLR